MKKNGFLPLLLLIPFLLSSCSCNHHWEDAFCVSAQVCTHCGQLQGTAQDHHSFSEWEMEDHQMVRSCMFCGFQEAEGTPIPSETALQPAETEPQVTETLPQAAYTESQTVQMGWYMTDITGHWISRWIGDMVPFQECCRLTTEYTLDIFPDGTYLARLDGKTINGKWTHVRSSESAHGLSLDIYSNEEDYILDGHNMGDFFFQVYPHGELKFYDDEVGNYYGFYQMTETTAKELETVAETARKATVGTWVSYLQESRTADGQITYEPYFDYTVTFHEDGTIYHSMPEWDQEHIVETNWYIADIPEPYCRSCRIDFYDDTSLIKCFFLYNFNHPSEKYMCLRYAGQGPTNYIYLKPAG